MTMSTTKPELTLEEQRVFYLLGKGLTMRQIADRLDMPWDEAADLVQRVVDLRGTPNLEAAREAIERIKKIRFV
jgi:hypothetical protein